MYGNPDELIEALAANERKVGELYAVFATLFPHDAALWSALAAAERGHARLLLEMLELVKDGQAQWGPRQFNAAAIQSSIDYIGQKIRQAQAGNISDIEALGIGQSLESSLLEADSFRVYASDTSRVGDILKRLGADTVNHRQRLAEELLKRKRS
jgi:rubrerythrin